MKLWIARDKDPADVFIYDRKPEWNDSEKCWMTEDQSEINLLDIPLELKRMFGRIECPPPGECWEFDVEFRRVK